MQSVSIVLICMLVGVTSIFSQDYTLLQGCRESARKENLESSACFGYPNWRRYQSPECQPSVYIIYKDIICTDISADYLKGYRESTEEGPSYPLTLKVTYSDIPVLPTSTFKYLKNVTVLILENINLNKIMPGAFNFLERLEEVYLGQNKLTTISDGIFNSLISLEKIDLSINRIEIIANDAFAGIDINYLNLSNNNISVLGEVLLNSFFNLSVLDISLNNLQNISSFGDLQIQSLNLSHNSIEFVDFEIFLTTSGTFVDVSFNKITKVANFNISNAYKIILSHNRLEELPTNDYGYTSTCILDISYNNVETIDFLSASLLEFYASFNFISSLSVDMFSGLYDLTHLYLDNNNLSSIPNSCFKDLVSLTHLNLSGNRLTQFKFGTFDNLQELQVLDISNNKFKELPQYTFHSLNNVTHLFFQNNEISNINTDNLVEHMKMLVEISLNNNTWSCQTLVDIVQKLKSNRISFSDGSSLKESNIHGIKCYENTGVVNTSNSETNLDSKFSSFFNEDFTETVLYKYFNQDFKNSEFFKYLESLRKSGNYSYIPTTNGNVVEKLINELNINSSDINEDFRQSEMYNYFNKDFKHSNFFKYLENFTYQTPSISQSEKIPVYKLDEISDFLKKFTKEMESLLKANNSLKFDFEKGEMYNYFNEDFRTSNFFKYLESLNKKPVKEIHSENINEGTADQLINSMKINEYPIFMLYVNATVLMLILVVILITAYRLIFCRNKKYVLAKNQEVELL